MGLEIWALGVKGERELGVLGFRGFSFLGPEVFGSRVWESMGLGVVAQVSGRIILYMCFERFGVLVLFWFLFFSLPPNFEYRDIGVQVGGRLLGLAATMFRSLGR